MQASGAFVEQEGPTALRADLVRALALSGWADVACDSAGTLERCCAGVCAVWNGRRGYVAVVVRSLALPRLHRFVYRDRIREESGLAPALAAAVRLAQDLGFVVDAPDFCELEPERQAERLRCWNQLRKTYRWPRYLGLAEDQNALSQLALRPPPPAAAPAEERAVLGRIGIAQRVQSADGTGVDAEGRLLSFF
jgi:hypothetical protein